jgi:hypothetical protein
MGPRDVLFSTRSSTVTTDRPAPIREPSVEVSLGDYIEAVFDAFLEDLGDEDLAEVATLALVQQRLVDHGDGSGAAPPPTH